MYLKRLNMAKEAFDQNNKKWQEELDKIGKPYLLYAPFSDDYWKTSPKIVFCNLEAASGGDDASEWSGVLAWETMKNNWMDLSAVNRWYEGKYYQNPTIWRYTVFAYILYKRFNGVSRQDIEGKLTGINDDILVPYLNRMPEKLLTALGKSDLEEVVKKILYMNLQKLWNENKSTKLDGKSFKEYFDNPILKECTLNSIKYSDADIFVVAGLPLMNEINKLIPDLELGKIEKENLKTGIKKHDKTLFVMSYHPAYGEYSGIKCFSLKWILDRVDEIIKRYSAFKKRIEN